MLFKRRQIGNGDVLYTDKGVRFTISDWSAGTLDIYGRLDDGTYICHKKMPPLYWHFPFISRRNDHAVGA